MHSRRKDACTARHANFVWRVKGQYKNMSKSLATKNVAAVLIGVGLVFAFTFSFAQTAKADALSDLQAQVNALLAQIAAMQGGSGSQQAGGLACSLTFKQNLTIGSTGTEVLALQKFLNSIDGTQLATTGAGSPGNETSYFGSISRAAVSKFQQKYGITPTAGYWGPISRAKANSLCTTTTPPVVTIPPGGGVVTPTGPGITIAAAAQPANSLAPKSAARVPFTTFTLTNNTSSAVTVNGITIQRTGLAQDAVFSGLVLVDQNGLQVGTSKTLNSNHQAVVGDTFTLNAGESKTYTVAGNMAADQTSYSGQVVSVSVIGVNTSVPVTGSLPITGAQQTVNNTLTLGSVSTSTSAFDPQSTQTKNIGDTRVKFSGIKFTAGSTEDLKLYSIRWRQVGTASSVDLANVETVVDDVAYPTNVSIDGKYYTTSFPGGLLIEKGFSKDMHVRGDIVGTNSASRTVDFDIDKVTDVYFVGQTYGYGVAPSGTFQPWYGGFATTINAGTVTTIGKANEVPAQNIAPNVANQPLGGFVADIKGEPISAAQMIFQFNYSSGAASSNLLTNVSLVDEDGKVVAGPVDGVVTVLSQQKVTFSDSVTFPTGRHIYTLKGKVPTSVANNVTITASTTPSSDWTTITGQTSGNTITISTGVFAMNTMTVKTATLAITMSTTPTSQTVPAGRQGLTMANVKIDASQSGEDVRMSSIPIELTVVTGVVGDITSCQLFDGSTALNTGSNVPTNAASGTHTTFTFDNSKIIPKGAILTLALKCNVSSNATTGATYVWSLDSTDTFTATGASGSSVTPSVTTGDSGTFTIGAATLSIATDPSSPAYTLAVAGTSGVTLGAYKFSALNSDVTLTRVGVNLGSVTASSTEADIGQLTLWAGGSQIGTVTFPGSARAATSTNLSLVVPATQSVTITVKGDLAAQGATLPSHPGALLTVDVDVNGATGNKNTSGISEGSTIDPTGSSAVSGVRVFRTVPTVARITPSSSTLVAQAGVTLYQFSIKADAANDLALARLTINVATSSVSTTNGTTSVGSLKVFAYTDSSFSNGVPGFTDGQVVATITALLSGGNNVATTSSILTIPKGQTYYFRVTGEVTQVAGSTGSAGSVTTKLVGDSAYPSLSTLMGDLATVSTSNFLWSPLSTTSTAAAANLDWTNGFGVTGLPSGGTDSFTLTK